VGVRTRTLLNHLLAVASATVNLLLPTSVVPPFAAAAIDTGNLATVIDNFRLAVAGILVALATVFLMVGGIRYLAAGGNRRELERGKEAMKSAAIGYLLAALSPVLIDILKRIAGL
jgi:membrane protein implicated in regulation of membrane protease activity